MPTKLSIFASKVIEAGWLAAIIVVPLFFNIYTARTFEPDKITLMRSIATVMLLAFLIKLVEEGGLTGAGNGRTQTGGWRLRDFVRQPMVLPAIAIVVTYIISTIFSLTPQVSWWGSYQRLQGTYTFISYVIIFALMALNLRTREQVDRLVTTIILTSVPVALYGIIQRTGRDPLPWAGNVTQRVAANLGNAIFVASYLIMIVPLTVSRMVKSMTAIISDEKASWAHTVLSAVYIFILAVQLLAILFSQSRGPMLGLLGAFAFMGMLMLMLLRLHDQDQSRLSIIEAARGIVLAMGLILAGAIVGGLGYLVGWGLDGLVALVSGQSLRLALWAAALGALLGFASLYIFLAATGRGWRWMWISWPVLAASAIIFVIFFNLLNFPGSPLEPLYGVPYLNRLGQITQTDSGTGRVRVLIWESALRLVAPHQPLGVKGEYQDRLNFLRPLVGYGPESMFNAFAFVYPPDLAHIEARGSSADRSHNETMDSLVMTGLLGFLAFYALMISLFYYFLKWLGWVPHARARRRLLTLMILGGLAGILVPYLAQGTLTFALVGLPFGLMSAIFIFVCIQAFMGQGAWQTEGTFSGRPLLLIGLLGAIIGHFIEVHFVFSIAATYTYFWSYAGLMVALAYIRSAQTAETDPATGEVETEETAPELKHRKSRRKRKKQRRTAGLPRSVPEGWDTWLSAQGLTMSIILIILIFDFVPPNFRLSTGSYSLLWMTTTTFFVGTALAFSEVAVRRGEWRQRVNWPWALILYGVTSLGYVMIYAVFHSLQFSPRNLILQTVEDVKIAADVLTNGLVLFYGFLFILLLFLGLLLSWGHGRGLRPWRAINWFVYVPLIAATGLIIWLKNIDVVRADIYLKEGERYRNGRQYDFASYLHQEGTRIDGDEDFYYLMLALDYQLLAQSPGLDPATARQAWLSGEEIAVEARQINKYNPDNTGNLGRYYFTMGQMLGEREWYDKAIEYFINATELAPQNVQYFNLWAQTLYVLGAQGGSESAGYYQQALEKLERSLALDDQFSPTWILLGDTYAARGDVDAALAAHRQAVLLAPRDFADQFFEQRLNLYLSAQRSDDLIQAFLDRTTAVPQDGFAQWALCHVYLRAGNSEAAVNHCQQALALDDTRLEAMMDLAEAQLNLGNWDRAALAYQNLIANNPNNVQAHSTLAYVYAQQGRLEDSIQQNQAVLQLLPDDYDSYKNLAILYQQIGDLEQALSAATRASELAPETDKASWDTVLTNLQHALTP